MVGIVLVSHSHRIAEGAAELARQMGGEDARIETAGGLDTPDHEIGTDAVLVQQAIERAWSDDGVLVLMDLGSAVLSAEMGLDLLGSQVDRSRVRLVAAPFVEGAVAAAVTARIGAPLEQVAAEARGALSAKASHLGDDTMSEGRGATGIGPAVGGSASIDVEVRTEHGLHARPAAAFVRAASAFDADVVVEHLTRGGGPVPANSLNAVATLGVRSGDTIRVSATGAQAAEAIDAVRALAERNFDEAPSRRTAPADAAATARAPAAPTQPTEGVLRGFSASPGFAVGRATRLHEPTLEIPDEAPSDRDAERRRLEDALEGTRRDVERQRDAVASRAGLDEAAIFEAHLLLLDDPALLDPVRSAVADGASAAVSWRDAVEATAARWERMEDEYQRARAADVRSVGAQVLARLLGVPVPRARMEVPGILVAADLAPADAASLEPDTALGVATAFGGPTSHAAVLARSLGIPAVVGLGPAILAIEEGTTVALDGAAGTVAVHPAPDVVAAFDRRRREHEEQDRRLRTRAHEPATTTDGVAVEVAANVGGLADVRAAVDAGCDGVGLFRTEFLFLDRPELPSEDEQEAVYREAAAALGGRPMIVRTLDAGADKPLPALPQPPEANPFLGVRGLRLGLASPEVLATQLRAILRAAVGFPVHVMFPMVATLDELRRARAALEDARRELERRGSPTPERLRVGVMVEVPSAALLADRLAPEVDFFSLGTNDLTQYTLAAERGNERVAALADPLHPAVLALIERTCAAADAAGGWAGVCGELAGDPGATELLLGLGVRELSMSAPAIPRVKDAVRRTDLGGARALADRALAAAGADEVRALLAER